MNITTNTLLRKAEETSFARESLEEEIVEVERAEKGKVAEI